MAVEVPVVIDIEGAFADAAAKVPTAAKPLEDKVDQVSSRISTAIMKMQKTAARGVGEGNVESMDAAMTRYANTVRLAAQQMLKLGEAQGVVKADNVNIRSIAQELSVLSDKWKSMKIGSKFDDDGKLRVRAQEIIDKFSRLVAKVQRFGTAVAEGLRTAADEAAAFENALTMEATTLDQLNTKLAAWRQILAGAEPATDVFVKASKEVQKLAGQIQNLNNRTKIIGSEIGSIDSMSAKMQELARQYNALSAAERKGSEGKAIVNNYRRITIEMEKEAKSLKQIVDLEKKLEDMSHSRTRTRQYEEAVLKSTANTMHRLSEQARILNERLQNAKFGTKQYEDLKTKLDAVNAKMQQMRGTVSQTNIAMTNQSTILRNLTSYASMYVSVFGFLRFAKQIRDVTGELEFQRIALGRLIQDMEYGNALFEKIKESAVKSPFRIKDLVTYTKQLAAYRIEEENLFSVTQRLADISAGLGVDMNRLILAYGQVRAASVLRGQELRQFTEAGIPLVELLAEKMGELNDMSYTTADVFKLISARAVPFSAIAEIFEDLTDKGGMFYKMQEEQAKTLKGRWEKLKDQFDIALQSIGESKGLLSFSTYNNIVLGGLEKLAKSLRIVPKLLEGAALAWVAYSVATLGSSKAVRAVRVEEIKEAVAKEAETIANIKGITAVEAYTKALIRQRIAATWATRQFWKLWAAIVANPWGAAIAAVLGLAAAIFSFRKSTSEATTELADFKVGVEELAAATSKFEKNEKLIDTYETLASKTDRTEEENRKLEKTMSRLKDLFPGLTSKINDETASLDDNVRALKDKNEEELALAKKEAEQRLTAAKARKQALLREVREQETEREKAYKKFENQQKEAEKLKLRAKLENKPYLYDEEKEEEKISKLEEKYEEWEKKVQDTKSSVDSVSESIEGLEKYLNGNKESTQLEEWRKQIQKLNDYKTSLGKFQIFTQQEIQDFKSVGDFSKDLKKKWDEAKKSAEGLEVAYRSCADTIARAQLFTEWKDADALYQALEAMRQFYGFNFSSGSSGGGYKQDPFINRMQERMKFMQDFKKGFDDLANYIGEDSALDKELGIMMDRGLSLGLNDAEQKRAAKDLSQWYADARALAFEQAKKHGASGSVEDFLRQDIKDTTNKGKALKDFQKLIQSLWDAQTDLDTSTMKKEWDDALKKLEEDLKRSETARNFFQDIFDLTGDKQLAADMAISVYGDPGSELAERVKKSIQDAMSELTIEENNSIGEDLKKALDSMDLRALMENLDKLPEKLQKPIKEASQAIEKHNADISKNYVKLLNKFDEMEQQRINIERQADKDIADLREGLALEIKGINEDANIQDKEAAKKAAQERANAVEEGIKREKKLQLSRLERDYRLFFSSVGVISEEAARKVARNQKEMLTEQFNAGQKTLAQYKRELREVDEQLKKYTTSKNLFASYLSGGVEGVASKLSEYSDSLLAIADASFNKKNGSWLMNEDDKAYIDKLGSIFGGKIFGVSGRKDVFSKLMQKYGDNAEEFKKALEGAADTIGEIGANFSSGVAVADLWVKNIGNLIVEFDKLGNQGKETSKWWNDIANVIMKIPTLGFSKSDDAGDRLAEMNQYAMEGFEKFKSGNFIGAFADTIRSWGAMFGPSVRAIDREIKKQDQLVDELEYSYNRLDVAMEKAFGSEYIYNYSKQLEILQAKAEAYQKQAELEESKGKKADDEKVEEYKKKARDVQDQIEDMKTQLSEFFAGTDITSAAEEFADAWIDAYKEFGSTADAMSEKFNDMIESMINRSLAAKIMQEMLQPIFDQIDTMSRDGLLSTEEIASIASLAQERIPLINGAMTNLMSSLAAAGLDVRTSTEGFKGISRDIAGASEESILGLAAAVNTQNFYMSYMPTINENVAAILGALTGDGASGRRNAPGVGSGEDVMPSVQQMVYDHLPNMDQNLAEMLRIFRSVVTTKNGSTNTNYVAVK